MMQLALLSSVLTHNARIIAGSPTRMVDGIPIARLGDPVLCPQSGHGLNSIAHVLTTTLCDGVQVAHVGAVAACGAIIVTGSPDTYVG